MKNLRIAKISLLVAIAGIVALLVFFVIESRSPTGKTREHRKASPLQTADRSVIRGLGYTVNMGEKARLTLHADEFRVGKKKVGFLRVSILNEAEIRNARIKIVKEPATPASQGPDAPQFSTPKPEQKEEGNILMDSAKAFLTEMESSKAFPGMSSKKIVSVKIAPVDFQIHEGNAPLLKISAGQAGFDLKNRKIVFKDRVDLSAGKESWAGDELSIDPQSGRVMGKKKGGAKAQESAEDLSRIFSSLRR